MKPLDGYYVNEYYVADNRPNDVYFTSPVTGRVKQLTNGLMLLDFPGVREGSWTKYAYPNTLPVTQKSAERIEFSKPDEQGQTRVIIWIQWSDRDDNDPEITLYSLLDENGCYQAPFELYALRYY